MGWATQHIEKLKNKETVSFRPRGNSMKGKIESGQLVTVKPVTETDLEKGDIVLCKVNGNEYIHLIKAIQGNRYQIGNNKGRINGWITYNSIYGKLSKVES
jgi:SOS-response transcriptional repressor LexA